MASDNPFDLTKLITNSNLVEKHKYKPEIYTTEEQKAMLQGYEIVPRDKWTSLPIGTKIRYIRKDGEMRKGGYIRYMDPKGEFMSVSLTPVNVQSKSWRLPFTGVSQIWRECAVVQGAGVTQNMGLAPHAMDAAHNAKLALNQNGSGAHSTDIQEVVASLKEDIRQLKIEIQRVMNQQKRIIKSVGINAVRLDRIEGSGRI